MLFSPLERGSGDVQFITSSQYDAIRAIINIKAIIVEVTGLDFPRSYFIIIFLPKVPLIQPKIGIIWSYSTKYHQLPEIPLFHPKIAIIWSY